jgi:hypothetical protein
MIELRIAANPLKLRVELLVKVLHVVSELGNFESKFSVRVPARRAIIGAPAYLLCGLLAHKEATLHDSITAHAR